MIKDPAARRAYQRKWRKKNKDKYNASQRDYNKQRRKANGDYVRAKNIEYTRKWRYGITQAQFDTIFAAQGKRCGCCRSAEPSGRGWCLDHNHSTNKPRGILCTPCNLALGYLKDSPEIAEAAAAYLRKYS